MLNVSAGRERKVCLVVSLIILLWDERSSRMFWDHQCSNTVESLKTAVCSWDVFLLVYFHKQDLELNLV